MSIYVGFLFYYERPVVPERVDRLAELMLDPRLPWQPRRFVALAGPKARGQYPKGKNLNKEGTQAQLVSLFHLPDMDELSLNVSGKELRDHAGIEVCTGTRNLEDAECFTSHGRLRASELPEGSSLDAWFALVDDFRSALDPVHGFITVTTENAFVITELSLVTFNRPEPPTRLLDEVHRAGRHRRRLGLTYARHPHWATYLSPRHVEAVGGEGALRALKPAVLEHRGELLYVQLTSFEAALGAEAEAKRRALEEVMRPILPPP